MKAILMFLGLLVATSATAQQINRAEYFFDTDPGYGNGTTIPVTPGMVVDLNFNASTAALNPGIHTLCIRTKSTTWSQTHTRLVAVSPTEGISRAEYFFDTDPGYGNGTAISVTPGKVVDLNFSASAAGLSPGIHTLCIRTKSTTWSQTHTRLVAVSPTEGISRAEYFFDTDPGYGNGTAISVTPGKMVDLDFSASAAALSPGIHTLYIRTKSTTWSQTHTRLVGISHDAGITRAEYFSGTDPGYGNGIPVTVVPGQLVMLDFNVENLSMPDGMNNVYVRTYAGFWSQTYVHEYCKNCPSVALQNTTVPEGESICYEEVETIVTAGDGTLFIVEYGAIANLVARQYVRMHPGTHCKNGSTVHALIGSGGSYCLNHMDKPASIVQNANEQKEALPSFSDFCRIWPNPTSGFFSVELRETGSSRRLLVDIYNIMGGRVRHEEVSVQGLIRFDISDLAPGMYIITVCRDDASVILKKIIIRHRP